MSATNLEHCGAFTFEPTTSRWWWAEQVCAVYGLTAGDVPTTELLLSRQHPDDRAAFESFFTHTLAAGRVGSLWHRVVDAAGVPRQVVTTTSGEYDGGRLRRVTGHVVDVTEAARRTTSREVGEALESLMASRPRIEQAKGALMSAYGVEADQAFAVLRAYSQHCNVKLRDVAQLLLEQLRSPHGLAQDTRALLDRLVSDVRLSVLEHP